MAVLALFERPIQALVLVWRNRWYTALRYGFDVRAMLARQRVQESRGAQKPLFFDAG
jgi:hypothetical protein